MIFITCYYHNGNASLFRNSLKSANYFSISVYRFSTRSITLLKWRPYRLVCEKYAILLFFLLKSCSVLSFFYVAVFSVRGSISLIFFLIFIPSENYLIFLFPINVKQVSMISLEKKNSAWNNSMTNVPLMAGSYLPTLCYRDRNIFFRGKF